MLSRLLKEQKWKQRYERHLRHQMKILIDLDSLAKGAVLPNLVMSPKSPTLTGYPIKIVLQFIKDGISIPAATITINNK